MAIDYEAIRADNERRYGTDIGRVGRMLLADRYDDRTHFIFELLQNAEDALARREGWQGSRAISFTLSATELRASHSGQPFNSADVHGICGIGEGTKDEDLVAIGHFGIGFKSVYAFTDRPEVHSGPEDFAIESYVWPVVIPFVDRPTDETVFVLPLRAGDGDARAEIAEGFRRLGPRTLLFLRQIEEIAWRVQDGPSGLYVRSGLKGIGEGIHRVLLLGEEHGKSDVEETWLLFSREAKTVEGKVAGHVEIAFRLVEEPGSAQRSVQPINESPLVAFFPTVLPTNLGFLVQGPYRTTPSRDNVPRNDSWNQHLVLETAKLLVDALRSLRDQGLLDVRALHSLPLDGAKFAEGSMFAPLFSAVREALRTEPLLPAHEGTHVPAEAAMLARTQELRDLFSARQLAGLFGVERDLSWLSGEITQDRTPELRQYAMRELDIDEATPEAIVPRMTQAFLEQQSDDWIRRLYEFLGGQLALLRQGRLEGVPLIRVEGGSHVTPIEDGRPQAFLPGPIATDFPTVRSSVCDSESARALLLALGLTEPDPVDDVVWNVLPKYRGKRIVVSHEDYATDIRRILAAFSTDSTAQRDKLRASLRNSTFVRAVKPGDLSKWFTRPGNVYLATERLKDLFAGVGDVLLVDDSFACLRGEDVRELLEACRATRYLRPVPVPSRFNPRELEDMRTRAGAANNTGGDNVEDFTLRGLDELLATLIELDAELAAKRAALLWESLCDVADRRGASVFLGTYEWFYFHSRSCEFEAAFVRTLNSTAWVPDANGDLRRPEFVGFDNLGWKPNPLLLSKIRFKPPIIDQLAKEAGIEPGLLDLLKELGVTSVAELRVLLPAEERPETPEVTHERDVDDALKKLLGVTLEPTPPVPDPLGPEPAGSGGDGGSGTGSGASSRSGAGKGAGAAAGGRPRERAAAQGSGGGKRTPGSDGGRPFISYVAVHPDGEESDPDGLDQQVRMALEENAVRFILTTESQLQRTPTHNPGYDLFEIGADGQAVRWIEVKAMTGSLHDRPVGLSHTQFECARKRGQAYWIYVVEHTGSAEEMRLVRIQDPAGKARTFTFDHGWLDIADVDAAQEDRED